MSKNKEEYSIAVDASGCKKCGAGTLWTVVNSDGVGIGQSFEDASIVKEIADLMNHAFERGKNA